MLFFARLLGFWFRTLVCCVVGGACVCGTAAYAQASCDSLLPSPRDTRGNVLAEAQRRAWHARYAEARGLYRWLLKQDAADQDAWLGLARVDAWEGCDGQARAVLIRLLNTKPTDIDVRAGLIDILLLERRFSEAEVLIERGLALNARAEPLLAARARLLAWLGDARAAIETADYALKIEPRDTELRRFRQNLFDGQARASARVDVLPKGYPNSYTLAFEGLQRLQRYEISIQSLFIERSATETSAALYDSRHVLSLLYHPGVGQGVALSLGFGAPSQFVPQAELKIAAFAPISARFTGFFAWSVWAYEHDKTVQIFAPALGYTPRDDMYFELRFWSSYVNLPIPAGVRSETVTGFVHSAALQGSWQIADAYKIGSAYTYGIQLDQNPTFYQLLDIRSHIVSVFGERALSRKLALQPAFALERRETSTGTVLVVVSAELGIRQRW